MKQVLNRKIIAVVGPTASGKTGIGVQLAKDLNGEIISADSRQIFRGLDIGSGKEGAPKGEFSIFNFKFSNKSENELLDYLKINLRYIDDIPQWLIDIVELGEKFSVFDWLPLARAAIEDIFSRGKVPIVVGGTGLYAQALVEGFALEQNRENIEDHSPQPNLLPEGEGTKGTPSPGALGEGGGEGNDRTIEQLRSELKSLDPVAYAKIDLNNPHRLIRAIERAREGLKPTKIKPDFEVLQIGVDLPREELYHRIDQRVEDRFEQGMLEEVTGLIKSGVDPEWLIKLGLEYRIITEYIFKNPNDSIDKSFGIRHLGFDLGKPGQGDGPGSSPGYGLMQQRLKFRIHAFARRQLTWFQRFPEIKWLGEYSEIEKRAKDFLNS